MAIAIYTMHQHFSLVTQQIDKSISLIQKVSQTWPAAA
jgi:hypothetical protein